MAKKKSNNRLLYYLIGAVVVLLIFAVVGKNQGWIGKPQELEVDMAKAKRENIIEMVGASGTVQPVVEVKLSPDVAGEIIDLTVQEGDSVIMGELLVRIRPDNWINQLERAKSNLNQQLANLESSKASLARAEATYFRAEQDFNRQQKLFKEKVISEADWQLAEQNYKVAKNDLEASKAQVNAALYIVRSTEATVKEAQENVRLTNVVAPMSGIVSKLSVEKGERVVGTQQMTGTEMLRIADLNKMEVRVNVNENDIIRVNVGDTANIDVDAYSSQGKIFKGLVSSIANTAKDKASADAITEFEVRIRILNESYKDLVEKGNRFPFRPGMTASVDIITERKENVLTVPLAAVTTRGAFEGMPAGTATGSAAKKDDKVVVFVHEEGKAKMVEVKTGLSDFDNMEILEGLAEGQEVITGPFLVVSKRLKDGDQVKNNKPEELAKTEKDK
ncbi:MAG TPA: efflux RND transporter periplasmic adaptor subunit [Cyclobacteriaceae bacterium]|nr:efflux RND transporter periplasmic adaptor subunit [Cyclobacteriaceae bacterium]